MITENNWVQTNIDEYCEKEKDADFVFTLVPYDFKKKSFRVAAEQAAKNIYRDIKKPLYILFSGGADSEFVVRLFHRLKIPFTVVIVDSGLNPLETKVARLVCEKLDIKPHIIETNEEEVMNFYLNIMIKHKKGRSSDSVPILMGFEYINSVGGVGITGATPAYDDDNIQNVAVSANEFYPDRFKYDYIGFFYYNIEIFYATLASVKDAKTAAEFKSRTYGTVHRNKSRMNYNIESRRIFTHIYSRAINKLYYKMGSVKEVLEYLKKWSI
jgi:predicted subunit of tRNA(5-methylaminomethyl-2-thiouridylate) methyltransferase